jgi:DNA modification methylase
MIYFHSSADMHEVKDNSARLVIASPPFTNRRDGKTIDKSEYLDFISGIYNECYRILMPGGSLVSINTDVKDRAQYNQGDRRYEGNVWLKHADLAQKAEEHGFRLWGHKIWAKTLQLNLFRAGFAHILLFSKPNGKVLRKRTKDFEPDVWLLRDSMRRRDSRGYVFRDAIHPAVPFICINELSNPGELVVSPFAGSGTIPAVAEITGRLWEGYEINRRLGRMINESIYGPRPEIYESLNVYSLE